MGDRSATRNMKALELIGKQGRWIDRFVVMESSLSIYIMRVK